MDYDLDAAIAQSLANFEEPRPVSVPDNLKLDEDYALALMLSEETRDKANDNPSRTSDNPTRTSTSSFPPSMPEDYPIECCFGCKSRLDSKLVIIGGKSYHAKCARCSTCGNGISSGRIHVEGDNLHHFDCWRQINANNCYICKQEIPYINGYCRFHRHAFFSDLKSCHDHDVSALHKCFSCNRHEPVNQTFSPLLDGRYICPDCVRSVMMESSDGRNVMINDIIPFYQRQLGLTIPPELSSVPVLLVDLPTLNEQSRLAPNEHHPITRGLCMTEERTIRHFASRGRLDVVKVTGHVTAILVLYGLPIDLTSSILAHECMHAYIRLSPAFNQTHLPHQVEEGLCQLVARLWLDFKRDNNRDVVQFCEFGVSDNKLRDYVAYLIEADGGEVYGEGFRKAAQAHAALGLTGLLEHVALYGEFPVT